MTQKFKFGDRVKSRNKIGFVLRHSGNVYVAWEDGSQSTVAANKLTLIPHPDTQRNQRISRALPHNSKRARNRRRRQNRKRK